MSKKILLILALVLSLMACGAETTEPTAVPATEPEPTVNSGGGMGMGMGSNMRDRHHAPIPEGYIGIANPIEADEASLARGAEVYQTHCVSCHGDGALGDGPAGAALDPVPAPIARTSQMMGDEYLYYRISEGGLMEPFNSTMPAWKDILDEESRWDVLNYVRALGSGNVDPQFRGGVEMSAEEEAAKHAEMIAAGVEQNLFTQADGAVFLAVHDEINALQEEGVDETGGGPDEMLPLMLTMLVEDGLITQEEADTFTFVHDTLDEAGLMQ
jgi:mono/diheme cytochrome c family protein